MTRHSAAGQSIRGSAGTRLGFTLLEILVALVLIGFVVGTLVPAVVNQIGKGEVNRISEDIRSIENAAKSFRADVNRWPQTVGQLVARPGIGTPAVSSSDVYGNAIPTGLIARWYGPYLERASADGDSIPTASGAYIVSPMDTLRWNGSLFHVVRVRGVSQEQAKQISMIVDGDTVVNSSTASENGRVRWKAGSTADTLTYLTSPIR